MLSKTVEPAPSSVAVSIRELGKCYHVYDKPHERLLQSLWRGHRRFYREFWALRDISFDVRRGETVGVIGKNGSGKSTLLQLVCGTLTPTVGEVEVTGRVSGLLELGAGFNPEFTGRENVLVNGAMLGLSTHEIEERFSAIEAFADIGAFIDQPIKIYSSGMLVRLAFAVQTAVEPDILIVDEALSVGDARFQKKCFDYIDQFRKRGGTILFVTHDPGVVVQICNYAVILNEGRIYDHGAPQYMAKVYHRLLFGAPQFSLRSEPPALVEEKKPDVNEKAPIAPTVASQEEQLAPTSPSTESSGAKRRELRYGSGDVLVEAVGIRDETKAPVTLLEIHKEYEFIFTARYHRDITERTSYGVIVSNTRGVEIFGTNSPLFESYLEPGPAGSVFECGVKLKMVLTPGIYFLTLGLAPFSPGGDSPVYDLWFDALEFHVIGSARCFTTSLVDLNAQPFYRKLS